jgi:hypothetical protein
MWWTNKVKIPDELRAEFEQLGETVLAQIIAGESPYGVNSARFKGHEESGKAALAWLREQHNRAVLHQRISMAMEAAILVFVAVEAGSTIWKWFHPAS